MLLSDQVYLHLCLIAYPQRTVYLISEGNSSKKKLQTGTHVLSSQVS